MKDAMAHLQISKLFKDYRKDKGLTQKELGEVLGIAQATISLIETNNYLPSIDILEKLNLLNERSHPKKTPPTFDFNRLPNIEKLNRDAIKGLNVSTLKITKGKYGGGDVVEVHRASATEFVLLVADAVGHGDAAFAEAQLLKVAFNGIITAQPKISSTLTLIDSIRETLKKSGSAYWARHSMLVAYVNLDLNFVEIRTLGLPAPIFHTKSQEFVMNGEESGLHGLKTSRIICTLLKGDSFLIYTDGLVDKYSGENRKSIENKFKKYSALFLDDSKTILDKTIDIDIKTINDDVTAVVVSRTNK